VLARIALLVSLATNEGERRAQADLLDHRSTPLAALGSASFAPDHA
jgi:hypothetical protein